MIQIFFRTDPALYWSLWSVLSDIGHRTSRFFRASVWTWLCNIPSMNSSRLDIRVRSICPHSIVCLIASCRIPDTYVHVLFASPLPLDPFRYSWYGSFDRISCISDSRLVMRICSLTILTTRLRISSWSKSQALSSLSHAVRTNVHPDLDPICSVVSIIYGGLYISTSSIFINKFLSIIWFNHFSKFPLLHLCRYLILYIYIYIYIYSHLHITVSVWYLCLREDVHLVSLLIWPVFIHQFPMLGVVTQCL